MHWQKRTEPHAAPLQPTHYEVEYKAATRYARRKFASLEAAQRFAATKPGACVYAVQRFGK
jgi:hypothetical protein